MISDIYFNIFCWNGNMRHQTKEAQHKTQNWEKDPCR